MLLRRTPGPPLSYFVDCIWHSQRAALPHRRERSLPTGCCDIVIPLLQDEILRYADARATVPQRLRGAVVQGPHDRFGVRGIEGASAVLGVHFRPGGAGALFGAALPQLRNQTVLLEELWGASASALPERLQLLPDPAQRLRAMEAVLLQRLHGAEQPNQMVGAALATLRRDPSQGLIEPLQRASGCTPTQFTRRFEQAVGLTPKRYARVLRFNALLPSLARKGPRDWAQVAVASGYFDQSHLIHEFRRLAGMTPTAYVRLQPDQPTHVAMEDGPPNSLQGSQ
jgi:AraC-like DNA-binding protein